MFSKLSIAVCVAATLQGAVAQEVASKAASGNEHTTKDLRGWEGEQDGFCVPVGTGHDWDLYFPCRHTREVDDLCLARIEKGDSAEAKQKEWKREQNCRCKEYPAYFDAAGAGCVGCKVASGSEPRENLAEYETLFSELAGSGYCGLEELKGDYGFYYMELLKNRKIANGTPPVAKRAAGKVEDYWTPKDPKSAPREPLPAPWEVKEEKKHTKSGSGTLPPVPVRAPCLAKLAPNSTSSKVAAGSEKNELLICAVLTSETRTYNIDGSFTSIFASASREPEAYRAPQGFKFPEVDIKSLWEVSGCSCLNGVIPEGNKVVADNKVRNRFQGEGTAWFQDFIQRSSGVNADFSITIKIGNGESQSQSQSQPKGQIESQPKGQIESQPKGQIESQDEDDSCETD